MRPRAGRLLWRILVWLSMALLISPAAAGPWPPRDVTRTAPAATPVVRRIDEHTRVVQLPAQADAYIASERPGHNFGDDGLFLGYNLEGDAYGAERVLLSFAVLSAIPPGAVVQEAFLRLHVSYADPVGDAAMGTVLRRLASAWEEGTVTWAQEPTWGEVRASAEVGGADTEVEWDVTGLVADWVDGAHTNHGVIIIGDERIQQRERAFFSREATSGATPHLVVEYTLSTDTEAPDVSVAPLPDFSPRQFEVTWSGSDNGGSGIHHYDVQYRIDGGAWADWIVNVDFTGAVYTGQDGRHYEFRARGVDHAGNVEPYGEAQAGTWVDVTPPTATVHDLPTWVRSSTSFEVTWSGQDDTAGIQYYDVRYRHNNGPWVPWQQQTVGTSAGFTATEDGRYAFEVRAVDERGLVEAFQGTAEAFTMVDLYDPHLAPAVWLPLMPYRMDP